MVFYQVHTRHNCRQSVSDSPKSPRGGPAFPVIAERPQKAGQYLIPPPRQKPLKCQCILSLPIVLLRRIRVTAISMPAVRPRSPPPNIRYRGNNMPAPHEDKSSRYPAQTVVSSNLLNTRHIPVSLKAAFTERKKTLLRQKIVFKNYGRCLFLENPIDARFDSFF